MSVVVGNNAWGVLATAVLVGDTSITLSAGGTARFPTLSGGQYLWVTLSNAVNTLEVIKVTAISGNVMTIVRAQDNTTAHAYAIGDRVDLRSPAALFNDKLNVVDAATIYAPLNAPSITDASLLGNATAVTRATGTNNTQIATTAFVVAQSLVSTLPGQTGNAGKFITTDGTTASWAQVYPSQAGNSGKFLTTDGTNTSWATVTSDSTQTLTDGATVAWATASGNIATLTLAGNRTMAAPTGLSNKTYILVVNQDATGSRTLTWNSVFKWPGGVAPTLSTVANAKDVFSFFSDGTNLYGSYLRGVA